MTEDSIHKSILRYLRMVLPSHWLIYHTPNGGSRHPIEAANMKGLGVIAGVPDLTIIGDGKTFFMEVKSKSGRVQPSQRMFMGKLEKNGIEYAVVRSIDDAKACLQAWGLPSREVRS
jgi:hypothetical protein